MTEQVPPQSSGERVKRISLYTQISLLFAHSRVTAFARSAESRAGGLPDIPVLAGRPPIPAMHEPTLAMVGEASYYGAHIFIEWGTPDQDGKRNRIGYRVDGRGTTEVSRLGFKAASAERYDENSLNEMLAQTTWDPDITQRWVLAVEQGVPPPDQAQ